jgi:hypothetical protein
MCFLTVFFLLLSMLWLDFSSWKDKVFQEQASHHQFLDTQKRKRKELLNRDLSYCSQSVQNRFSNSDAKSKKGISLGLLRAFSRELKPCLERLIVENYLELFDGDLFLCKSIASSIVDQLLIGSEWNLEKIIFTDQKKQHYYQWMLKGCGESCPPLGEYLLEEKSLSLISLYKAKFELLKAVLGDSQAKEIVVLREITWQLAREALDSSSINIIKEHYSLKCNEILERTTLSKELLFYCSTSLSEKIYRKPA